MTVSNGMRPGPSLAKYLSDELEEIGMSATALAHEP